MKQVLVTGSAGFLGRNVMQVLSQRKDLKPIGFDIGDNESDLNTILSQADVLVHLAGVNRPESIAEYETGNARFTAGICDALRRLGRTPRIIMSSSIQAELDNPYGMSKRNAEIVLQQFAEETGSEAIVFRFKNIFGKWSRPNYNSVVATFCFNATHGLPLTIYDREKELELVYVDDVVDAVIREMDSSHYAPGFRFAEEIPGFRVKLGYLADMIAGFGRIREDGILPDLTDGFTKCMYSTYLSYLDGSDMVYPLAQKTDARGSLAEFVKSPHAGQIFLSRTKPGITRGNHYHNTKVEKFMVIEGHALISLKHLVTGEIVEHEVRGEEFSVVDIPPGYTHSIQNIGDSEMIVLFWANEIFDPSKPDTFYCEVRP